MKTNKLVLAALLASLATPAFAEEGPAADPRAAGFKVEADGFTRLRDGTLTTTGPTTFTIMREAGVRSIKNAPYSAQIVNERQQNLSDGNQIAERHATMAYRDSAGRTRQEVVDAKGELKLITIHDPVAGATWILKPQDRTATKIARLGESERQAIRKAAEAGRKAGEAAHARVEQMRKDGALPTVERHKLADGGEEIVIKRVARADGEAREHIQQDVRIQVSKALEENSAALRDAQVRLAPLTAGAFGDMKWASKATTKDLGTRDFNGVKAEGKLRSYEIPAGEIGNRNAIVVSDETWYAPDLQVTVYTKHSDPRSGDTVFRLDSLKREEPAASLFSVPSDYTVKDPLAKLAEKAGKAQ
jgi:predicted transcriptional regulator